jgi:sn-glycerol 3-phosphate transport system ATP-binding protein
MTLGQRLIVMNGGRIEQIGTPEAVYGRPASTFVAGFIGSPPMNLISGHADGSRFTSGSSTLALPEAAPRGGQVTLGLRPEHVQLDQAGAWSLNVDMVEMLGAERLVHGRLGDSMFTLRIDATLKAPQPGQTLGLRVPREHLHWFDADTGKRL